MMTLIFFLILISQIVYLTQIRPQTNLPGQRGKTFSNNLYIKPRFIQYNFYRTMSLKLLTGLSVAPHTLV